MTLTLTAGLTGAALALLGLAASMTRMRQPPATRRGEAVGHDLGLIAFVLGISAVLVALGAGASQLLSA